MKKLKEYYTFDNNGLKNVSEAAFVEYTENAVVKIVCFTKTKYFVAYIASDKESIVDDISDLLNDIFIDCMLATGNDNIINYKISVY